MVPLVIGVFKYVDYYIPLWVYFKLNPFETRFAEIVWDNAYLYGLLKQWLDGYGVTPGVIDIQSTHRRDSIVP